MRRIILTSAVGLALLATACGGSSGSSSSAASTGGTTGTAGAGTTGTSGGLLAAGSPCIGNARCQSGVCGADGTGNCCASSCATSDPACGASGCDDTGACTFPVSGTACGAASCSASVLTSAGTCNGSGTCAAGTQSPCSGNFTCLDATSCAAICTSSTDCVSGFFCVTDGGTCDATIATGPCTENDACASGVCGASGTGHCCMAACANTTAPCGTADCDGTGACTFPTAGTACGTIVESCASGTQQNPSACDGTGNCNDNPGTTSCTPYVCGASACLASCTDGSSCVSGDFCDVANTACCFGLSAGGTLAVDSQTGSDAACCGIGADRPCQTLTQAMKLIDSSGAQNVTITATVGGAGGDWAAANEVYPIALGWGVELSAPGVFFTDQSGAAEVFDIKLYSARDPVGYASIAGTAASPVSVGMDSLGDQTIDASAVQVEAGNSLYIANASVNGSASKKSAALTVNAGATLWLAEDQSAGVTGTVTIGNDLAASATDGYNGIVCATAQGLGCTISDATLKGGASSVVIEGQEGMDIDAEDGAVVTLSSSPTVGIAPSATGFGNCPSKPDSSKAKTEAILLNGSATMTFSNGAVQCISGDGFRLQAADKLASTPTLTLDRSTIQNTEYAVDATAGAATIKSSTIEYNYNGVLQGTDGTNNASVDLGGGGVGTNTVVCSNSAESIYGVGGPNGTPAVSVLNTTTANLDADNVNWDTNDAASPPPDEPDLFSCGATLLTCSCVNTDMICTVGDGVDGMDAVNALTGTISQKGAGLSAADCTVPSTGQACGTGLPPCPPGDCCSGLTFTCVPGQVCPM